MLVFFIYLLKLTISLAIVYLFYQLVLRRLTFYNHNRWYLVGYSLICFAIPFIDISSAVETTSEWNNGIVGMIPVVDEFTKHPGSIPDHEGTSSDWNGVFVIFIAGMMLMIVRLLLQFISFTRLRRNAKLVSDQSVKFYQVNKKIIPFSFGNSIFVNQALHTERELREIIRHEFVHVKQRHSIDIILAEIICIVNWYNPFAWLIRRSIRQNLEFIADGRVLENGMDRKQYQYLLLKVMGNNHFSMGNPFNFSSLKNRIVMMNKMRSAKVQMARFLFILPLLGIILLSFRSVQHTEGFATTTEQSPSIREMDLVSSGAYLQTPARPLPQDTVKPGGKNRGSGKTGPVKSEEPKDNHLMEVPLQEINISAGKSGGKPHIIVDEVEWPQGLDINLIDPAKIETMHVWKGAEAQSRYGDKGKNGVIVVTTKNSGSRQLEEKAMPGNILYLIDGEAATKKSVDALEPKKVKSVNVLKGVQAEEKYGDKGKNGVVEIITINPTQINYIEKKPLPVFDIRNVLVGKKTQEC